MLKDIGLKDFKIKIFNTFWFLNEVAETENVMVYLGPAYLNAPYTSYI